MLQTNDIIKKKVNMTRSKSEQQLQNEKLITIKDKDNQVILNRNSENHYNIQMDKQDGLGETIKQDIHENEIQQQQVIKDGLHDNQNKDQDQANNNQLQMINEQIEQKIQDVVLNGDVHIQMENPEDIDNNIDLGTVQKQVTLLNFDQNSNGDNNNLDIEVNFTEIIHSQNWQKQNQNDNNKLDALDDVLGATCPICASNFEKVVSLLECQHKFCWSCYKEYLEEKIKIAKINNIPCLQEGCTLIFSEEIIKSIISEQKFQLYLVFKRKYEIENDPNKKWCPAKGCDRFIERDPKNNLIQCECGQQICFNCGQIAHQGMVCEDAIQGDFKQAIVKYLIKNCPKCKSHIQKNSGCNHMTCTCSFQFCWICLQPYHENHYRYWSIRGCAIWSNGRFKTSKVITDPDKMRQIYFVPRLIFFILRGPFLIVKFTFKAIGKSIIKPFVWLNKKMCKSSKPKLCLFKCIYCILAELLILLIVILFFPFNFVFYRLGKEIFSLARKGCSY